MAHKCRKEWVAQQVGSHSASLLSVYEGGGLCTVSPVFDTGGVVSARGQRGAVTSFSQASRKRMLETLGRIRRDAVGRALFVTLTYPGHEGGGWPSDPKTWKRNLRAWWARVEYRYPEASAVWRMEPQDRGAPHFHLMVFGVEFLAHEQVARDWWEICGSRGRQHLEAGTQTVRITSPRQGVYYVSKYAAKVGGAQYRVCIYEDGRAVGGDVVKQVGRQWGVLGRKRVPWATVRTFRVPDVDTRDRVLAELASASGYGGLARRGPTERVTAFLDVVDGDALQKRFGLREVGAVALRRDLEEWAFLKQFTASSGVVADEGVGVEQLNLVDGRECGGYSSSRET